MRNMLRAPTPPGEILSKEFLKPLGLTQKLLADHIDCDIKVINRIVNGRSAVTAEMAVRLAAARWTPRRSSGSTRSRPSISTEPLFV